MRMVTHVREREKGSFTQYEKDLWHMSFPIAISLGREKIKLLLINQLNLILKEHYLFLSLFISRR